MLKKGFLTSSVSLGSFTCLVGWQVGILAVAGHQVEALLPWDRGASFSSRIFRDDAVRRNENIHRCFRACLSSRLRFYREGRGAAGTWDAKGARNPDSRRACGSITSRIRRSMAVPRNRWLRSVQIHNSVDCGGAAGWRFNQTRC